MTPEKPAAKVRSSFCPVCHQMYQQNPKGTRKFCSSGCKQQAYRNGQTTPMEQAIRKQAAIAKRISTKSQTRTEFQCAHCGKRWFKSGLEGNRMYCDDSCKQAAYRKRVADDKADQVRRAEVLQIHGFHKLASYFYKMHNDYKACYGQSMVTEGTILEQRPDGYHAVKDGQTIAYFQTIGICVKWLQKYYAERRPNWAMLRSR